MHLVLARVSQDRSIKLDHPLISMCFDSCAWSPCKFMMGMTCATRMAPPGNVLLATITHSLCWGQLQHHTHERIHTDTHRFCVLVLSTSGTISDKLLSIYLVDEFLFLIIGGVCGSHRHTRRRLTLIPCLPKDSCAHPVICFHNKCPSIFIKGLGGEYHRCAE